MVAFPDSNDCADSYSGGARVNGPIPDALTVTTMRQFANAVTNPDLLFGWLSEDGLEVGSRCPNAFVLRDEASKSAWAFPQLWSNMARSCLGR